MIGKMYTLYKMFLTQLSNKLFRLFCFCILELICGLFSVSSTRYNLIIMYIRTAQTSKQKSGELLNFWALAN